MPSSVQSRIPAAASQVESDDRIAGVVLLLLISICAWILSVSLRKHHSTDIRCRDTSMPRILCCVVAYTHESAEHYRGSATTDRGGCEGCPRVARLSIC